MEANRKTSLKWKKNNYDKCNDVIEKKKRKSKQIYDRSFKTKNGYNFGRR